MPPDFNVLELWLTAAALMAGVGLASLMVWLERRPRRSLTPRLVPTTPILFLSVLVVIATLVHLLELMGVQTGR